MQPQSMTQVQMLANIIVAHEVSSVTLAPSSSQPAGATGDARIVMVNFTDGTLPVNLTVVDLKAIATRFGQLSANATASAAKATTNQGKVNDVVALTASM